MMDGTALMVFWPRMVAMARCFLIEADHTDWEDAASAAMEDAVRNPESIAATGSVEGWLMQATRWKALQLRQKLRREQGRQEMLTDTRARLDAGSSSHVTTLDVRGALATLPPTLQQHAASRMTGRSLREVGEALGHTKATAYHHEIALRTALQERLSGASVRSAVVLRPPRRPSSKRCSIDECEGSVLARGWCRLHYLQWWRAQQGVPA